MSTEYWEVWYPKAGATGLLLARGLADATQEMLLHSAPEVVTVEVRDTGSGIPEDALPHVFELFYRADPARGKAIEGVGLGLSLVKWIVDQHGGTIHAVSRVNEGSSFTIRLPNINQN